MTSRRGCHITMPFAPADRPVVVRFAALGDVVLLTVLLEQLARRHGTPVDLLASGGWTRTLLANDPAVADIQLVTSRKSPYWFTPSQREAVQWLAAHKGPVYLCDPDKYARRLVERAVPRERIIAPWDNWPGLGAHWADWWHSIGSGEPLAAGRGQPRLHASPDWVTDAHAWARARGVGDAPILLIQPGNKKTSKRWSLHRTNNDKFWPVERWVQVITGALQTKPELRVVVCGSPREADLVNEIVAACADSRVLAAAEDLPLPRLIGLASFAHSMISIDTGPAHIAAAMDCPCVVLFGYHGWGRWVPRAPHSQVIPLGNRETKDDGNVASISAADALAAWQRLPPRGG